MAKIQLAYACEPIRAWTDHGGEREQVMAFGDCELGGCHRVEFGKPETVRCHYIADCIETRVVFDLLLQGANDAELGKFL